jgi:class 3 adenylate cyclase/tetratricopeptide (TPR) repeat protein
VSNESPDPLSSFVPASVRRWLAEAPVVPPAGQVRQGAILLADIAGFTPLAEALARKGAQGAEELTLILNEVLGALVERIEQRGGEVLKFAGDALLAAWTGSDLEAVTSGAASCALELHAIAADAAAKFGLELGLTVGLGAGAHRVVILGDSVERWECLPVGPALSQAVVAAREAKRRGDTVVSAAAWGLLSTKARGVARPDGHVALASIAGGSSPAPLETRAPRSPRCMALVNRAVRDRLDAGVDWLNELRRVTALFVHLELRDDETLARLQAAFVRFRDIVERGGGTVDKLTIDEKGLVAVAAFGLPPHAHGDDAARAVEAAVAVKAELAALASAPRVGLATGRVFCGAVGSATRREYTVIGDTVNLAARLMLRGDGICCDEATALAARDAWVFRGPEPMVVKGKAEPVRTYAPAHARAARTSDDPIRGPEQAALREALDALRAGAGGLWQIEGEAGQGKSLLVRRFLADAAARGFRVLRGGADASDRGAPYRAFRPVATALLGLDGLDDGGRIARLEARLAGDPFASARRPLLGEVIGLPLPDNEATAPLTGEVRAFNTQDLVVHLLGAAGAPLVIALDDVHLLDSASIGLLRQIVRRCPQHLVVTAGRPAAADVAALFADLTPTRRLSLSPLAEDATARLLRQLLDASPDATLVKAIHERSEGNPFVVAELARSLAEAGRIVRSAGPAAIARLRTDDGAVAMPDTVQGVILARIDGLEPVPQLLVKVASVIGRSFPWSVLQAVHPVAAHRPALRAGCEDLVEAALTEPEVIGPEPAWRYVHETTREVAYELLLYAQRRQLHEAVASALDAFAATPNVAARAYHWEQAGRPAKAVPCLEAFGDQALREGAYVEAARAFERAAALARDGGVEVDDDRRAHWEHQLGEALLGIGRLAESRAALERAVALLGFRVPGGGAALAGDLALGLGRQLVRRLAARPRGPNAGTDETSPAVARHRKAARAALRIIETCFFLAGPLETTAAALRALDIAEAAGPSPELARAYALVGWIASMVPLFRVADHYLALANAMAALPGCEAARQPVSFFTGFTRTATGRWEEARGALTHAIDLAHARGDKRRWIEAVCGICSPLHYQGEYEARVELGKGVLYAAARRHGDRQAEAWGILDQLESLLPLGDLARISPLLDELEPYLGADIGRSERVWGHGLYALGRLAEGRAKDAFDAAVRATDAAAAMNPVAVYVFEGHASACEVLLALLAGGRQGWTPAHPPLPAVADAATLHRELRRALHELARYARVFPYAGARRLSCDGRAQALRGSRRAAATLRRAVEAAVAIRMPLEEGIARRALGVVTKDPAQEDEAQAIFSRLGAGAWARRATVTPGAAA